jgi:hypothetical protein
VVEVGYNARTPYWQLCVATDPMPSLELEDRNWVGKGGGPSGLLPPNSLIYLPSVVLDLVITVCRVMLLDLWIGWDPVVRVSNTSASVL